MRLPFGPGLFDLSFEEVAAGERLAEAVPITGLKHWFYDVRLDAFYPQAHTWEHSPTAVHGYQSVIAGYRHLLLGGRDGYLRHYDDGVENDDGEPIVSYVMYCPVRLAGDDHWSGKLISLIAVLADHSGDVGWEIRVGPTHEEAAKANVFMSGTWTGNGLQHTVRPHARGGSVVLRLSNGQADRGWTIEEVQGETRPAGKTRLS